MNIVRSAFVLLLSLGLASISLGASQDEIRQLIEAGEYGKAITQADALLSNLQTPQADHYEILMLKGEAGLRAGQRQLAVPAFRAATRMAVNRGEAIAAAANAILAQRSANGAIRIGDTTFDVIKPESRLLAMEKLSQQMLATQAVQVQNALTARTLDPITDVLPDVYRAYVLETQATDGKTTTAENLARKLGTQAHDLILDELRRVQRDINSVEQSAYTMEQWPGWVTRSLTTQQRRDLRNELDYVSRIRDAILEIRRLVTTLRVSPEPWDRLTSDCVDLQDQITSILGRSF